MARVAIVDDSPAFRSLLKDILTDAGHEVVAEAENGQIALAVCQNHQPDVITLDIGMPIVDGITALKMIRAALPAAKVVMISAACDEAKVLEALRLGASYYILKPCDAKYVITVINDVLSEPIKKRQSSQEA